MSGKYNLDRELITSLFKDVEASGVSRFQFDLPRLVNKKSYLYGEPASKKRRAVQKKFADAKRKTHRQYLAFLGKFGVDPGEALKSELLELEDRDADDEVEAEEEVHGSEDEDEDVSESSDSESSDSSVSTKPSRKPRKRPTPTKPPASKKAKKASAPVVDISFEATTPKKRMNSDSETSTTEETYSTASVSSTYVLQNVAMLERPECKQDGSMEKPYIIIADPQKPETCAGFEVALIPQVKVGNFVRSVFHIRHVTTQGMEDEWSATIPHKEFPTLADRCVLIRGPSQELWHRRPDLYHDEPFCEQTLMVHETHQTAINQSITRPVSYWLLVLPKGTKLENYIISHDSVHVVKGIRELATSIETEDETNGTTELETLYGMDVYWRIALAGGDMVKNPLSATKKRRKKKTPTKA